MYQHEPVGRGFIHYHINHEQVCVINPRAILHEAFISKYSVSATYKLVDVRLVSCSVFLGNEIGINLQI